MVDQEGERSKSLLKSRFNFLDPPHYPQPEAVGLRITYAIYYTHIKHPGALETPEPPCRPLRRTRFRQTVVSPAPPDPSPPFPRALDLPLR